MQSKVNKENGYVNKEEFQQLTEQAMQEALEEFNKRATFGDEGKIEKCRVELKDIIKGEVERYKEQNDSRNPWAKSSDYIVGSFIGVCEE